MLCSLCLTNSMCWPWRTRVCSTTCCSPPVLKTLLEIAIDRKHLGAEIGVIGILHTWGQNLLLHPHIHCVIPAGGLSPDHRRWIRPRYPFFLPVKVLSRVFRGKFSAGLKRLHHRHQLCCAGPTVALADPQQFAKLMRRLHRHDWVVYAKPALVVPCRCYAISAATPIAWRFPIIACCLRPGARHLSLEGLCSRWQARQDDSSRHGVPASFLSARSSQRVRAHSSLRVPRESLSRFPPGTIPTTVVQQLHSAC